MRNMRNAVTFVAVAIIATANVTIASAQTAAQKKFLRSAEGQWCGPGEIVAGKYKDTRFKCDIGLTFGQSEKKLTMSGACRVGVFPKPMQGEIIVNRNRINGQFFGDSPRDRLDVSAGKISANKAELIISRENITGNVSFQLMGDSIMKSTVSVRAGLETIPVINMRFERCDG